MLIILEQLFCQAHGPTSVVSDCAINNLDLQHGTLRYFRGIISLANAAIAKADLDAGRQFTMEDMTNIQLITIRMS
jgi:hypothetical protein